MREALRCMDLSSLNEFVVLADVGNYLEAADQLFIAQSTLSRHIKAMEEELGVLLFDRNTRKIALSEFGKVFLPYAKQILSLEQQYQYELFNYKRKVQGTLSIGSIPSMSHYGITDALFAFQKTHPEYALNTIENDSDNLITMVLEGKIDLAFIRSSDVLHTLDPQLESYTYAVDSLAAIMPSSHPLSGRSSLSLKDLAQETLLLLSGETFMFRLCVTACREAGFIPNVGFTGHRAENILSMGQKGAGVALLTQSPIKGRLPEDMVMVPIEPAIETSINLICRKDKKLSTQSRLFLETIRSLS